VSGCALDTFGPQHLDSHAVPERLGWPDWVASAQEGTRRGGPLPRPKTETSPYYRLSDEEVLAKTRDLLAAHPLSGPELVTAVLDSWNAIFDSRLGSGFQIGREIMPVPQIMAFFLHALVPLELARAHSEWRADLTSAEKDLVYTPNAAFSIEMKTSSHPQQIFGNRSFGVDNPGRGKKAKDGYYLAVNFDKWAPDAHPRIRRIRFGWLDHTDWVAQRAETGQQSALPATIDNRQLLTLYSAQNS